jgi:predicted MPP superfamily phosphohydrolase
MEWIPHMAMISRRNFLRAAVGSVAAGGAACVYGHAIEPAWLDIVRVDLPLRRLPDAFAGLTIAQISDLHFGRWIQSAHIDPVIQTVMSLGADVIVVTGDIVSHVRHGEPEMVEQTLGNLSAPDGVYAVLGNHDWWADSAAVQRGLSRAGVTVLRNQHLTLHRNGQILYLLGLDDVWCGKHDLQEALQGIPPTAVALALVHEPDFADTVALDPRVILQLSGHTHGGQVRVPFYGPLRLVTWGRKYPQGQYQVRDLTLYTNRGIGVVGYPVRFACRPEITLFTLKPAQERGEQP